MRPQAGKGRLGFREAAVLRSLLAPGPDRATADGGRDGTARVAITPGKRCGWAGMPPRNKPSERGGATTSGGQGAGARRTRRGGTGRARARSESAAPRPRSLARVAKGRSSPRGSGGGATGVVFWHARTNNSGPVGRREPESTTVTGSTNAGRRPGRRSIWPEFLAGRSPDWFARDGRTVEPATLGLGEGVGPDFAVNRRTQQGGRSPALRRQGGHTPGLPVDQRRSPSAASAGGRRQKPPRDRSCGYACH